MKTGKTAFKPVPVWQVLGLLFLILSICFTFMTALVDRQPIGQDGTEVGFGTINAKLEEGIVPSDLWDKIGDAVLALSILIAAGFAVMGLYEWIRRKSFIKVDPRILAMGVLFLIVIVLYVVFDKAIVVNYRPAICSGDVKPSFPSTHTICSIAILGAASIFVRSRTKNRALAVLSPIAATLLGILSAVSRLLSGKHWAGDIFAALLFALTLLCFYHAFVASADFRDAVSSVSHPKDSD